MKRVLSVLMALACLTAGSRAGQAILPANHPWIYTCSDNGSWVYQDNNGVLHFFSDIEDRYNLYTQEYQTLIKGRWMSTIGMKYWRIPYL